MAEDWRVTFTFPATEPDPVPSALRLLHEHDADGRLRGRVAVSGEGEHLFLYADTEEAATEAEQVVSSVLVAHGLHFGEPVALDRWHPLEERWENARVAVPATAAEREAEHERLEEEETAESEESGVAEWEVRIEFASHHDAAEFADRLEGRGWPIVRRWKFLLVGADDEDDAHEIARRLELDLPAGARIRVEPGGGPVWEVMGNNPFAVLGGLGG